MSTIPSVSTNEYLTLQTIEHETRKTSTYGNGSPDAGLEQVQQI